MDVCRALPAGLSSELLSSACIARKFSGFVSNAGYKSVLSCATGNRKIVVVPCA
jgi:hypothetical protein